MRIYACYTEQAHPKCPYGKRIFHEIVDICGECEDGVVGTNQFGEAVFIPHDRIIRSYIAYMVARERALYEFKHSVRTV